jgi:hypothetical protein
VFSARRSDSSAEITEIGAVAPSLSATLIRKRPSGANVVMPVLLRLCAAGNTSGKQRHRRSSSTSMPWMCPMFWWFRRENLRLASKAHKPIRVAGDFR